MFNTTGRTSFLLMHSFLAWGRPLATEVSLKCSERELVSNKNGLCSLFLRTSEEKDVPIWHGQ